MSIEILLYSSEFVLSYGISQGTFYKNIKVTNGHSYGVVSFIVRQNLMYFKGEGFMTKNSTATIWSSSQ